MDKFSDWLQKVMAPVIKFTGNNKFFTALRDAFSITTAFLIAGSFALLGSIFITGSTGLAGIEGLEWLANYGHIFSTINYVGVSCITLIVVLVIGYQLGKSNGQKPLITMILGLTCFMIMLDPDDISSGFSATYMFLGFICAFVSVSFFSKLMKFEKIKIKLPDSVPPMIADSFNSLIPVIIVLYAFGLVAGILYGAFGVYANDIIYTVIQAPFSNIVESLPGVYVIIIISQLLWWCGIHGTNAMKGVTEVIWTTGLAANAELIAQGLTPTHWYTKNFMHLFTNLGGAGQVIGLAVAILLLSKREDWKQITKVSMVPVLCGIDEPLVFGLPIMLNPILLIPFIVAPLVCATLGYFACATGFLENAYILSISGMPMFLQQILGYNGQISVIILTVLCIVISTLIYAPFVIVSNKQAEKEGLIETSEAEAEA